MSKVLTLVLGLVALVVVCAATYKYSKKWKEQKNKKSETEVPNVEQIENDSNKKV